MFPWQQKVVYFSGVVDRFLVVENMMIFFFFPPVWVSRSGGGRSLWGVVAVYAWKNLEWV